MRGTRKGFGNVGRTDVTPIGSLMQVYKEVHGLLRRGVTLTTTRLSVKQCCIYGVLFPMPTHKHQEDCGNSQW